MKKLMAIAAVALLFIASCAQKEEKREEFKEDKSAEHMRNIQGDSAVSATVEIDSANAAK